MHCAGVLRNLFGVTQLIIDSVEKNGDDCTKTYDLLHAMGRRRRRADATTLARDKPQAKQIEGARSAVLIEDNATEWKFETESGRTIGTESGWDVYDA